jgi:anti-sigma factor RsiW
MSVSDQDDERLSAYLAGELDDAEVAELESRLTRDASLAARLDAVHDVIVALRGLDQVVEPQGLTDRLRERVAQERATQEQATEEQVAPVVPLRRRLWLMAFSAAAVVVTVLTAATLLPWLGNGSIMGSHLAEQAARAPQAHVDERKGAGSSFIVDSEAVLASKAAARTYLTSLLSTTLSNSSARSVREAIAAAPPFRSGFAPGACLDTVASGSSVARVESVVYDGQPALAYVVRRGGSGQGGSDPTDALVIDPATCTVKLSVSRGEAPGEAPLE